MSCKPSGKKPVTGPLRFLSSLAEGADRLVALEALKLNPEFVAVLPMASEEFQQDFPTSDSREEFQRLLGEANQVVRADKGAPPNLPSRYTSSDLRIAASRHLLIALWDGLPTSKEAGTAWVVGQRLDDPTAERAGPVVHILCRRTGQAPLELSGATRWLLPGWVESDQSCVLGL